MLTKNPVLAVEARQAEAQVDSPAGNALPSDPASGPLYLGHYGGLEPFIRFLLWGFRNSGR